MDMIKLLSHVAEFVNAPPSRAHSQVKFSGCNRNCAMHACRIAAQHNCCAAVVNGA
jgi:hypothetical protein